MNQLPIEKRVQIIQLLVEGSSLRAASRISGCSINTVTKLLVDIGRACEAFHDMTVHNVTASKVQCDEIWSFVYAKEKNVPEEMEGQAGSVWTWSAIDAKTKLIISWYVGDKGMDSAKEFIGDVASRVANPIQLSTDGNTMYLEAIQDSFELGTVDYGILYKIYGKGDEKHSTEKRYSPVECTGIKRKKVIGKPNTKDISTSHIERQHLTMRMHMRRFTRLTNAFSKKLENHCHAIALHFVYYNFVRIHKSLRVTPAMEAGITKNLMTIEDLVNLADDRKH